MFWITLFSNCSRSPPQVILSRWLNHLSNFASYHTSHAFYKWTLPWLYYYSFTFPCLCTSCSDRCLFSSLSSRRKILTQTSRTSSTVSSFLKLFQILHPPPATSGIWSLSLFQNCSCIFMFFSLNNFSDYFSLQYFQNYVCWNFPESHGQIRKIGQAWRALPGNI